MKHPKFKTQKDLFAWLYANKQSIIATKKATTKWADAVEVDMPESIFTTRAISKDETEGEDIQRRLAINTTLILDSHDDVHMNGIWNQSIKVKRYIILNQEHDRSYEGIISEGEDVKVSVQTYTWRELGYKYKGDTEVLQYDANITPDENPYMYAKYKAGKVRNHSVEMGYVRLTMAINDPDYKEEFAEWEKVRPLIVNGKDADERGYFFPIYAAKPYGGAAVPRGSNFATPVIDIKEPVYITPKQEPPEGTQKSNLFIHLIN